MTFFAKTLPGLEGVLLEELTRLGATEARAGNRGVSFAAEDEALYRILIHTRLALRVLVPLTQGHVTSEQEIYDLARSVTWHEHMRRTNTFAIETVTLHPEINHSAFLNMKTKDAVADAFRERFGERPSVNVDKPDVLIHLHLGADGEASLYLDASGRSLNQRGYRTNAWKAPLNEVLAAGVIVLSGWDPDTPFFDPMCGSGTLLIEAALMAKRKAPGLVNGDFGVTRWPAFRKALWQGLMMEARTQVRRDVDWIHGGDIDPGAVKATIANLKAASLARNVHVKVASVEKSWVPEGKGMILCNPPYGDRLGDREDARALVPLIQQMMKTKAAGYKVGFLTGDPKFKKLIGLREDKAFELKNGPLDVELLMYTVFDRKR